MVGLIYDDLASLFTIISGNARKHHILFLEVCKDFLILFPSVPL